MKVRNPHVLLALIFSFILIVVFCKQQVPEKETLLNTSCSVVVGNLGYGTGNYVNNHKNPYVLTCKHVIQREGKVYPHSIMLLQVKNDNEFAPSFGKVVLYSKTLDFALIELDKMPQGAMIARYANSNTKIGDTIFFFGPVSGRPGKMFLFSGFISQKNIPLNAVESYDSGYIYTIQGTSGSTVFNKDGEGVGIVCRSSEPQCIYLSSDIIRKALNDSGIPAIHGILDGTCNNKLSKMHNGPIELP